MVAPDRFRFLNEEHTLASADGWNPAGVSRLWTYNLHYFDDLNAMDGKRRRPEQRRLIQRWIRDNPPGSGAGWEPYPLSLRMVNWIKWALSGNQLDPAMHESLVVQARWLQSRLEFHLLGNHLFANAKALVFVGSFFTGSEAGRWLERGMRILDRELQEQVLPDGGHFERSTMYHALFFEDLLDLANLAAAYPSAFAPWREAVLRWPSLLAAMERWLRAMCHPDGEIAFFNDSAMGIAPKPAALFGYGRSLGLPGSGTPPGVTHLAASGYIRVDLGDALLLVDVAPVGPDYLPGHAHADTLSFELSLFGQRVVVNSGTSRYGLGPERDAQRGTAAHSTLEIDGRDSSEVWAGFRVARRARPFDVSVHTDASGVTVEASHDGYRRLPGRPVHHRRWLLQEGRMEVLDQVLGSCSSAVSRVHFHPFLRVELQGSGGSAVWPGRKALWRVEVGEARLGTAPWHPEFGASMPSACLEMGLDTAAGPMSCRWVLEWS